MFTRTLFIALTAAIALTLATTCPLYALPTQVVHQNTAQCDPLSIPTLVDEIGDAANFPADEALSHIDLGTANPVCSGTDLPAVLDALVSITNLTNRDFAQVWYVADHNTSITNFDGEANDIAFSPLQEAFRIDNNISDPFGIHHPLLSEDATQDGIWEAGETWAFVLQDYMNLNGLPPDAITSRGVGDASTDVVGFVASSGSIIAIEIPEPGSALLALFGCVGMTFLSRRRGADRK